MAKADGTVYINTAIEADGMQAGSKEVEAACRRMAKKVNGIGEAAKLSLQKQLDAFAKQNQMYDRQAQKVQELEEKLKEMSEQKVETAEYKAATKEVERLDAALLKAYDRKERFIDTGGSESSRGFQGILHDIEVLETRLRMATRDKENLEKTGAAYQNADTSALEDKYIAETERLEQMHNALGTSYESLKQKLTSYGEESKQLINIKKRLIGAFAKLSSGIKSAASAIIKMNRGTDKSRKSFGASLKTIIKYTLGIRSLFVLFNRARAAIKEGFGNLAQYSAPVNASISSLMSALTQLKNSLATAFAPILNVVAPILTTFINLVSRAVTAVGMLIATLTGAKSFTRATAVQQDYAASLEGSAGAAKDAAKEQQKYLSGLDEVRTFTEENDSSGGGGGGAGGLNPSDMFEEVEIPSKFGDIAQMIKDAWAKADFSEIGTLIGTKLSGALDLIPWDNIQSKCNRVAQSIGTFINGFVATPGLWQKVGYTIGQGINTAVGMWNTFFDTTKFQPIGEAIATALNTALDTIDAYGLGRAITQKIQAGIETAYGFVTTFDWEKFGTKAGEMLNGAFHNVDFAMSAQTLSGGIIGALNSLTATIQEFDWYGLGQSVQEFLVNIDWAGIFSALFAAIGAAFAGLGEFLLGLFSGAWNSAVGWWKETAGDDGEMTIGEFLSGILNGLGDVATWVFENIVDPFCNALLGEDKWEEIKKAGEDIINGFTQGIKDFWSDPFGWIKENIVDPFVNGFKELFGINSPSTVMEEQGGYVMQGLLNGIKKWIPDVGEAWKSIKETIGEKWEAVKETTGKVWNTVTSTVSGKWNDIKTSASEKFGAAKDTVTGAWENIKTNTTSAWETVKTKLSGAWENIKTTASTAAGNVKTTVGKAWDNTKTDASTAWNNVKTTLSTSWSNIKSTVSSSASNVKSTLSSAWSNVKSNTSSSWSNIKSTISTAWSNIKSNTSTAASNMRSTLSNAWSNIKSNTSSSWSNIKSTVSTAASNMRSTLSNAWSNIRTNASIGWSNVKSVISTYGSNIISTAGNIANSMATRMINGFSSIVKAASEAFSSVRKALSSLWDSVKQKASQIGEKISSAASGISYSFTPNSAPVAPVPAAPTPKIPYLASGAVIPPRAAFLAVLGDQKNGNNLEMPESLLRKVVREESGNGGFSGTIRIPLYINGRQVMEAVLEEAQLKQMISGRNPFEMA